MNRLVVMPARDAAQPACAFGMYIPAWIRMAMPDDVQQEVALAALIGRTDAQRRAALRFGLRELRRTQWARYPAKPAHAPSLLRPSKVAAVTGYRTDSVAHREARLKVDAERRRAIARKGQRAWREGNFFGR